ncbi:RNA polymerase sigma factor SigE [Actinospica sp. MGRD01-02]|uniref:RNA polymerase sigma factor SigE n=1 Tax=Actinospica acidithermotolerans TaxID=2828514 RepID=A0A941II87_9ACTN|nr:RNA polymerase sigma factor SigE [Actinospica acidithermotolerans]
MVSSAAVLEKRGGRAVALGGDADHTGADAADADGTQPAQSGAQPDESVQPRAGESSAGLGPSPVDWTPPSWEEVVRTHSARVYRLAYRLTGDRHDAEDLTQEVFVRVFRSLSTYAPGTFEGWLHRITTNLFLDQARRKSRIRFEGLAEDAAERLPGREPTPAQAYFDTHLDGDIEAALAALPPEFRAAVVLCDIEGLSYEEIAATLGVKLGTVRSRIHRGRAQLRAALAHRDPRNAEADEAIDPLEETQGGSRGRGGKGAR